MSILTKRRDDNRNKGDRKGKGPKPMHSKKQQKKLEEEQGLKELEKWNIYGDPDHSDPILKKGYIDQTSMESAVKRWNSDTPLMQRDPYTGRESENIGSKYTPAGATDKGKKGRKARKRAQAELDYETAKETGLTDKEIQSSKKVKSEKVKLTAEEKATKKAAKRKLKGKDPKKGIDKANVTAKVNALGEMLYNFATPEGEGIDTATERKAKSEEAKTKKTKVADPFDEKLAKKTKTKSDDGSKDSYIVSTGTSAKPPGS